MSDQENTAVFRRYFDDVRNRQNVAVANQIFSPDVIVHVDTPQGSDSVRGIAAIRQTLQP
jgi:hypothetical protein